MANSLYDYVTKFRKFEKCFKQLEDYRKKYDNYDIKEVKIDNRISLKQDFGFIKGFRWYVLVNGNEIIRYDNGLINNPVGTIKSVVTLGMAKGSLRLVTKDKHINKEFIDKIAKTIEEAFESGQVKQIFIDESDKKWN